MAKTQFLMVALALMAVAAVAAPAPGCKEVPSKQTGYLQTATPAGCLNEGITQGLVDVACFESVLMNITNSTGCPTNGALFNVSFVNMTCLDGIIIGGGEFIPDKTGGQILRGEFPLAGMKFEGIRDTAGMFTVSVDGVNCELAYGPTKRVGPLKAAAAKKVIPAAAVATANATAANATSRSAGAAAAAPAEATTPAAPAKSSAAVVGVNAAVVMVLGAAMALAF